MVIYTIKTSIDIYGGGICAPIDSVFVKFVFVFILVSLDTSSVWQTDFLLWVGFLLAPVLPFEN